MKKRITHLLWTIFFAFITNNIYAQPGDYEIVNDTDCDIDVKVYLYDYTGTACASNCNYITDTGWITVSANSTHIVSGAGYATGWWNKIEIKNPDYPASCTNPPNVTEEAGPCATPRDNGASCDCNDIKVTTDNCTKATIEVG